MLINNPMNQMRLIIVCAAFMVSIFVNASEIIVNKIPGGGVRSIVFTDQAGKIIKLISAVAPTQKEQLITSAGDKFNHRVELLGNSNYALMTEYIWPAESHGGNIQVTIRLYDSNASELFSVSTLNSTPQALSETGAAVFIQSPPEEWVGTEEEKAMLSDVITVYDKIGNILFEHKENPFKTSQIAISPSAKWLVLSAWQEKSYNIKDLVLINLVARQTYRESMPPNDPVFTYLKVLDDGSLIKISDIGGARLPDGSIERIKKTIVLKKSIQ